MPLSKSQEVPAAVQYFDMNTHESVKGKGDRRPNAVTITLQSSKDDCDERAQVKIELDNPDAVVNKMLQTLAHKFPPESVMTIAASRGDSTASSSGTTESSSSSSSIDSSHRHTKGDTRSNGDNESMAPTSGSTMELSPVSEGLHFPSRFSGRHFLGNDGIYYPELADLKGRPIEGFVRDPKTGGSMPVGRPALNNMRGVIPNSIVGPNGTPIPGTPLHMANGFDHITMKPKPFYSGIDGSFCPEAVAQDGKPMLGFAVDPVDSQTKPVGPAVRGSNGQPLIGVIRGPSGNVIPGIPLKPVPKIGEGMPRHTSVAPASVPLPRYTTINGSSLPVATGSDGQPRHGYAVDPVDGITKRVGLPHLNRNGDPVPGLIRGAGDVPVEGIPIRLESVTGRQPSSRRSDTSHVGNKRGVSNATTTRLPAPVFPLSDGTYAVLAVGQDGRPINELAHDPVSGQILRVGRAAIGKDGRPMRGFIRNPAGGRPISGLAVDPKAWDRENNQAIPHYHTTQDEMVPIPVGPDGTLLHGLAVAPDGQVRPVGLPYTSGEPGLVISADGRVCRGIALNCSEVDNDSIRDVPRPIQKNQQHARYPSSTGSHPQHSNKQYPSRQPSVPGYNNQEYSQPQNSFQQQPARRAISRNENAEDQATNRANTGPTGNNHNNSSYPSQPQQQQSYRPEQQQSYRPEQQQSYRPEQQQSYRPDQETGSNNYDNSSYNSQQQPNNNNYLPSNNNSSSQKPYNFPTGPSSQNYYNPAAENNNYNGERIVTVPKKEYVEIEKRVPKIEHEYIEKRVEVPVIQYHDRNVEVPQIEHVNREVRVKQIVNVPKEIVREIPKIETRIVEKEVQIPGPVIEVPKIEYIEKKVMVPFYEEKEVPTVIAQKLQPLIRETNEIKSVPCIVTEPRIITVDVFIPKPVVSALTPLGKISEEHVVVDVPVAQFNALVKRLNLEIDPKHLSSLFAKEGAGVPMLPPTERVESVQPIGSDWSTTHRQGQVHCTGASHLPYLSVVETMGLPIKENVRSPNNNSKNRNKSGRQTPTHH